MQQRHRAFQDMGAAAAWMCSPCEDGSLEDALEPRDDDDEPASAEVLHSLPLAL